MQLALDQIEASRLIHAKKHADLYFGLLTKDSKIAKDVVIGNPNVLE